MPPWPSSRPGWLFELQHWCMMSIIIILRCNLSAYHGLLVVSFSVLYCTTFYILKKSAFRGAIAKENAWKVSNQVRLSYKIVGHEK